MKESKKYLFTIVLYISNDDYLKTIKSMINQNINFGQTTLLVLSHHTSVDISGLKEVLKEYSDNILYIGDFGNMQEAYKKSSEYIKSDYVNFAECGADYNEELFSSVKKLFETYEKTVNVVMGRCEKIANEAVTALMDSLPKQETVVDMKDRYRIPPVFFNYCFISTDLNVDFSNYTSIEDLFLCRTLIEIFESNPCFAISGEALITPSQTKSLYMNLFASYREDAGLIKSLREDFFESLLRKYDGAVVPNYVQNSMLLFIYWCAGEPFAPEVVSRVYKIEEFKHFLCDLLAEIDDEVIVGSKKVQFVHKYFFLKLKYGNPSVSLIHEDKRLYFGNCKISLLANNMTKIEFVRIEKNRAVFDIRAKFFDCEKDRFTMFALRKNENGESRRLDCEDINRDYDTVCFGEAVYLGKTFRLEVDLTEQDKTWYIELYCVHNGYEIKRKNIVFGKFAPLAGDVPSCYYYSNGHILSYDKNKSAIEIKRAGGFEALKRELKYLKSLKKINKEASKNAVWARIAYRCLKLAHRRKIWLISDRTDRGDDNGEAFLKYMNTIKPKGIAYYFVIDPNSDEGKRIAKFAKVIPPCSRKHKFYHLLADRIISSQANDPVVNPFLKANVYYRDILCDMKFAFLQHGVIKDDLSSWLNLYSRNLYGFVVTTRQEYQSILEYNYFYPPENVWLTGLPRHDYLYHDEQKYITIMPTWRKYLMKPHPDPITGQWILKDDIGDNEFCRFYRELFTSKRLLKAVKDEGYTLCLKPHPVIAPYVDTLFEPNENIRVFGVDMSYREIFAKTNLLLTDFSSVVYDFAYLRKPIIYAHFDVATFRSGGHSYTEGYYDYERDGFGEVAYNVEDTVDLIIEYMKNGCKLKDKYRQRINSSFAYSDQNCCKRVYDLLIK